MKIINETGFAKDTKIIVSENIDVTRALQATHIDISIDPGDLNRAIISTHMAKADVEIGVIEILTSDGFRSVMVKDEINHKIDSMDDLLEMLYTTAIEAESCKIDFETWARTARQNINDYMGRS